MKKQLFVEELLSQDTTIQKQNTFSLCSLAFIVGNRKIYVLLHMPTTEVQSNTKTSIILNKTNKITKRMAYALTPPLTARAILLHIPPIR